MDADPITVTRAVVTIPSSALAVLEAGRSSKARTATPHFPENRIASIAEAAYFRAEKRGFEAGHELEDWLAAEADVDARLIGEGCAY